MSSRDYKCSASGITFQKINDSVLARADQPLPLRFDPLLYHVSTCLPCMQVYNKQAELYQYPKINLSARGKVGLALDHVLGFEDLEGATQRILEAISLLDED